MVRRCKQHEYTEALDVGGGIVRIACSQCGSVHLELSSDDTIARAGLFQSGRVRWMAWEPDAAPVIQYERTFGKRSARRRKAQPAVA